MPNDGRAQLCITSTLLHTTRSGVGTNGLPHAVGGLCAGDDHVLLICPRHHQDGKCISTTRPDITTMLSVPNIREVER